MFVNFLPYFSFMRKLILQLIPELKKIMIQQKHENQGNRLKLFYLCKRNQIRLHFLCPIGVIFAEELLPACFPICLLHWL